MKIVESVQPYNTGGEHDPLAILNHLDIVDKHRELLATVATVELPYYGSPAGVKTIKSWISAGAVVDGQEVMSAVIDPPQPKGRLDGHVELTVKLTDGFIPAPLYLAASVDGLLEEIAVQLTNWVLPAFDWFFATHERFAHGARHPVGTSQLPPTSTGSRSR
jgi:hypothetical protein